MAQSFGVPYLGRIPLDPCLGAAAEAGRSVFDSPAGECLTDLRLNAQCEAPSLASHKATCAWEKQSTWHWEACPAPHVCSLPADIVPQELAQKPDMVLQ